MSCAHVRLRGWAPIEPGSTRAASTFLVGRSVHPTWIGAT
nr:MAG TPA: hypothetical protein [Caudoviricetes sp.]